MRTKCPQCMKRFLSYDVGDICPSCDMGYLVLFKPSKNTIVYKVEATSAPKV
jgi:hypothetical protein